MKTLKITASELEVGHILVDYWGTRELSCDARVTKIKKTTRYVPYVLSPGGRDIPAIDFWVEPLEDIPNNPHCGRQSQYFETTELEIRDWKSVQL